MVVVCNSNVKPNYTVRLSSGYVWVELGLRHWVNTCAYLLPSSDCVLVLSNSIQFSAIQVSIQAVQVPPWHSISEQFNFNRATTMGWGGHQNMKYLQFHFSFGGQSWFPVIWDGLSFCLKDILIKKISLFFNQLIWRKYGSNNYSIGWGQVSERPSCDC